VIPNIAFKGPCLWQYSSLAGTVESSLGPRVSPSPFFGRGLTPVFDPRKPIKAHWWSRPSHARYGSHRSVYPRSLFQSPLTTIFLGPVFPRAWLFIGVRIKEDLRSRDCFILYFPHHPRCFSSLPLLSHFPLTQQIQVLSSPVNSRHYWFRAF